jgi:hypothetical protein
MGIDPEFDGYCVLKLTIAVFNRQYEHHELNPIFFQEYLPFYRFCGQEELF